jgi:error-prone DNA polymerase
MRIAIIAADYSPGEADQLRRDMAAWRRTGRMDKHYERLMTRMTAKGIAKDFALRLFEQIKGFGEYGFPESHAASFALICYVTCWLKCHYPTEFVCAILNAQPMGFYSPATLIEDAKRHGVAFRPVDVGASAIDCMLEDGAVRMGLRYIKGLRAECAARIVIERHAAPFASLEDFIKRVRPDRGSLSVLAEAGAFDSLGVDRRRALWEGAGLLATLHDSLDLRGAERTLTFRPLDTFEAITWDFQTGSHSTRGHPLAPLRPLLLKRGLQTATVTNQRPHESRTEFAGLVICRQRPGTASGVVFMTLEDETGVVNVIVWPKVYEKYRAVVLTESLLGVTGHLQNEQGVVHLIAEKLWPVQLSYNGYRPVTVESHDFY